MSDPLAVWIRSRDRSKGYPLYSFISLDVTAGKWPTRDAATLTFRPTDSWVSQSNLDIASPEWGAELSLDVYWRNFTTPLFSGPVEMAELREDRGGPLGVLQFRSWMYRLLSSRMILDAANSKLDYAGKADAVLKTILDQTGFSSATPVAPSGYPGGVSRKNFGGVTSAVSGGGGTHSTTINPDVSEGRRVLEEVERLLEGYDMALTQSVSSSTVTMTIDDTYQNTDLTDEVVIDLRRGTSSQYTEKIDYTPLENVLLVKGSGSGGSQAKGYTSDATSITDYGVYEGGGTYKEADATAVGQEATLWLNANKDPVITFDATAIDSSQYKFNADYFIRDLVTVRSGPWTRDATKLVVGAKLSVASNAAQLSIELGDLRRGYDAQAREMDGTLPGRGRGFGSRYKAVSG